MNNQSNQSSRTNNIASSVLTGVGFGILSLLAGTILDYIVVQILSQFFLSRCSEDCYFAYFNSLFVVVVILSIGIGIRSGLRTHKRLSEKS